MFVIVHLLMNMTWLDEGAQVAIRKYGVLGYVVGLFLLTRMGVV